MNNIKKILDEKRKSINWLSQEIGLTYKATHNLINRDNLNSTKLETLKKVSTVLGVDLKELYLNSNDYLDELHKQFIKYSLK